MFLEINYLAVALAAISTLVVGGLWYSKVLFGLSWMKEMGWDPADKEKMKEMSEGSWVGYVVTVVTSFITAFVISLMFSIFPIVTCLEAVLLAAVLWFAFIMPFHLGKVFWEKSSWKLFFLNSIQSLVSIVVMSLIIGAFVI